MHEQPARTETQTHPGKALHKNLLPTLSMSQTEFARRLGVSQLSLSELLTEKRTLPANMAVRIGSRSNQYIAGFQ
jgi:antitoxin HigA-1